MNALAPSPAEPRPPSQAPEIAAESSRAVSSAGEVALMTLLRAVPKNGLSRLAGAITRARIPGPLRRAAMRAFAGRYGIDLDECSGLEGFETFGEFFSRPLLGGLRPIAPGDDVVVSPVDSLVSRRGNAVDGRMIQAKGLDYTVEALLADAAAARRFVGGCYATLYLSPRDYHRIHFPMGGRVTGYRYVPGMLWPVNAASVKSVPGLFTVNERLVTFLETPFGACAVVAIGATIVGRIRAYYDAAIPVSNLPRARMLARDYTSPIAVAKGAELGAFEMGSTVILLIERDRGSWLDGFVEGARVRVGEAIGRVRRPA